MCMGLGLSWPGPEARAPHIRWSPAAASPGGSSPALLTHQDCHKVLWKSPPLGQKEGGWNCHTEPFLCELRVAAVRAELPVHAREPPSHAAHAHVPAHPSRLFYLQGLRLCSAVFGLPTPLAGLKVKVIFLPRPSHCWDYRCTLPRCLPAVQHQKPFSVVASRASMCLM